MSWTDSATIKKHLMQSEIALGVVENEEHTLWGTDSIQLKSTLITADSEEVKTIDSGAPYSQGALVLTGSAWADLDHADIVPQSVTAADDQHRSTVFIEGTDYVVDYENGLVRRTADSSIGDGNSVYFWYQFFTIHLKDTDYTFDNEAGTLARIEGGGIANGGIVFVDYTSAASTIPDMLIDDAIIQAEDKILARLSDAYTAESPDQGLKSGATELTVAIICNAKAMDIMNTLHSADSDDMARQWREMSHRYEAQAWRTLAPFIAKPALRGGRTRVNTDLQRG